MHRWQQIYKITGKDRPFMYIDNIKIFAKNKKNLRFRYKQ